MKRILMLASLVVAMLVPASLMAQKSDKQLEKQAKKEAKDWVKKGWEVMPGSPSIQDQVFKRMKLQSQTLEDGSEKYVVETGTGTSQTRNAAKLVARQMALVNIAQAIEAAVAGSVEGSIESEQAFEKVKMGFASRFAKKLTNTISCVEMYKAEGNGFLASITIAYDKEEAIKAGVKAMRKELEEETKALEAEAKTLLDQAK